MLEPKQKPIWTPTQMFSCEYCYSFEITYFEKHLRTAASARMILGIPFSEWTRSLKSSLWNRWCQKLKVCCCFYFKQFTRYSYSRQTSQIVFLKIINESINLCDFVILRFQHWYCIQNFQWSRLSDLFIFTKFKWTLSNVWMNFLKSRMTSSNFSLTLFNF